MGNWSGNRRLSVEVKGGALWLLLLLLGGCWGFEYWLSRRTMDEAADTLKPFIAGRIAQDALNSLGNLPPDRLTPTQREWLSSRLIPMTELEVNILGVRGMGHQRAVKASVLISGRPPPDGRTVRYYVMNYALPFGWTYSGETGRWGYWLKVW